MELPWMVRTETGGRRAARAGNQGNRTPSANGIGRPGWTVLSILFLIPWCPGSAASQVRLCEGAVDHLRESAGMATVVEEENIDDWRLDRTIAGCRVTAAGLTRQSLRTEAAAFYDGLRDAGWTRTPDPQDAPNEASLRFRNRGVDCLFNVYDGGLLGTDAELTVDDERVPGPGQRRYNVLVLCTPAEDTEPGD